MHDMIIKGGTVYDGTGAEPALADVAVDGDKISVVGRLQQPGRVEIDATGKIVTPGFVDVHTHFDGQVTWDPLLTPSSYHGVTTIVTGNCGVGFAPCKADQRDWLIGLMEGVEDIPGTALHEGIQWGWETFPEYLNALDRKPLALDVGTQVPHSAVRAFVMGQRGVDHIAAKETEIASMASIVKEAIQAGALGFSTSRTVKHVDVNGVLAPSIDVHEDELVAIAKAVGATGTGVLQGISDFYDFDTEFALFKKMARESGRPMSLTVEQHDAHPDWWKQLLDGITTAQAEGVKMYGQVPPRAPGVLLGLTATLNPFLLYEVFQEIASKPLDEQVATMRTPEFRKRLLNSKLIEVDQPLLNEILSSFNKLFPLCMPLNYEPDPKDSFAERALAQQVTPQELIYDALLEKDGRALLYHPIFNYQHGDLEHVKTMLDHPYTYIGLSDAGAHCGSLCDASFPTTLLQHWGRDRTRGEKIPLRKLIKMLTSETAQHVGLSDRGVLKPGYKADINVIDVEQLVLLEPEVVSDLPANGRRLIQRAIGYEATVIAGKVAFRNGESTGQLNGKLIRGFQPAPV